MEEKTYQTVVGFHAGAWDADKIMELLLAGGWSATLTQLPDGEGSIVALSLEGFYDDARPALARHLEAQGFKIIWWSAVKTKAKGVKSFSSGTFEPNEKHPVQPYGVAWAPIVSTATAVRTVLSAETGMILACSRAKKPQVSELVGLTKIYLIED